MGLLIICSSLGKRQEKYQVAKKPKKSIRKQGETLSPGKQRDGLELISIFPNISQQNKTSVSCIAADSWLWREAGITPPRHSLVQQQ